jgi:hypothetical protein
MCRNCFKKDKEIGDSEHDEIIRSRNKMKKILGKNYAAKSKGLMPVIDQLK